MVETYATVAVLTALTSIFIVVRHTRQNEETGRAELLASGVTGRYAALTVAVLANLALAALVFAVLRGVGLPATGSLVLTGGLAATGIGYATAAGVTAQVAESTRAASGLAATPDGRARAAQPTRPGVAAAARRAVPGV
jgi:ABC-2 type transport system permease protein